MKYLSVCSGIEAATCAWHHMGWEPVAFSEIEKFPSAVLAHHYPNVPNWGDMTKFKEWPDANIDVLVGGTPCQSFSVAGLRKGLDDPRGNLMLTYLAIAQRYRPQWLCWENVPGVISDQTDAFKCLLDGMEELGYIVDCDILDAQFHGVAQRRRRIFVCGQHRDYLLSSKTDTSAATIIQCLQEILHGILVSQCQALGNAPVYSDLAFLSKDGVQRRMKLFGLLGESSNCDLLQKNLLAVFRKYHQEQNCSDALLGASEKELMQGDLLMGSRKEDQFTLTEQSLSEGLADSYAVMKLFITLTATKAITAQQIFSCSRAVLIIAKLMQRLNQSSPSWWSAASSTLIAVKEYTNYARFTSSDLFGDLDRIQAWRDFIRQADELCESLGNTGVKSFGTVFPVSDCLSGHPAPSRQARKGTARGPAAGAGVRWWDGGDVAATITTKSDDQRMPDKANAQLVMQPAHTFKVRGGCEGGGKGYLGSEEAAFTLATTQDQWLAQPVAGTLGNRGLRSHTELDGHGAYIPVAIQGTVIGRSEHAGPQGSGADDSGAMFTLTKADVHAVAQPVPYDFYQITAPVNRQNRKPGDPCHTLARDNAAHATIVQPYIGGVDYENNAHGMDEATGPLLKGSPTGGGRPLPAIATAMQVRRLTPVECERLQGFPDGYTNIPWRNKPESPDGPRYKALGNSMAVPVMRWIGKRINEVSKL